MLFRSVTKRAAHFNISRMIIGASLLVAFSFACADTISVKKVQAEEAELEMADRVVRNPDTDVRTAEEWFSLGAASAAEGDFKNAKEAFKEAIKRNPDYAEAHHRLGLAYKELGDTKHTLRAFKEAVRINPDYTEAYYSLGTAYREVRDREGALQAFKDLIRIDPSHARAHCSLGEIYLGMHLKKEAKAAFINAIDIKPDFAEAHYGLGSIYVLFNDIGAAFAQYKILMDLDRPLAYNLFKQIYN